MTRTTCDLDLLLERLRLYGQGQRLSILRFLTEGPRTVSEIENSTGIGQPALSQQLGTLRRAGIITGTRQSRDVIYNFSSPAERDKVCFILSLLSSNPQSVCQSDVPGRYSIGQGAQFASILP